MKLRRVLATVCVALALCILLSGCNIIGFDVENQLIPPQNDQEQDAMQAALQAHLKSNDYMLTYPTGGKYQTPFIVLNQIQEEEEPSVDGDETEQPDQSEKAENPLDNWGVVFYRWNISNAKTKILLLHKNEKGQWGAVADVEGRSDGVAEVEFADLDGDEFPELLVGWNLYNTSDKCLSVYRLNNKLSSPAFEMTYTMMVAADMTDDTAKDVLLMTVTNPGEEVKAQLYSMVNRELLFRGETLLDKEIHTFQSVKVGALSPTVNGAFVDCAKGEDVTITELIYWDNSSLESPFSDKRNNTNTTTVRQTGLLCNDFNGDGVVEWPTSQPIGEETEGVSLWYTEWRSYDFRTGRAKYEFSAVVNLTDAYMIRLRDDWAKATATYDPAQQILTLREKNGDLLLELLTTNSENKTVLPDGFAYVDAWDTFRYAVRINTEKTTVEEVQFLFAVL